jgi:hypothetical protein
MSQTISAQLGPKEILPFASDYLHNGRKLESWQINSIAIEDKHLVADVSMTATYASTTDAGGFHLTVFSTLEFLSELMIIYAHVWAGLNAKVREGWMVESSAKLVRSIRDPEHIKVEMQAKSIRKRGDNLICIADYKVTDQYGGLFEVSLKGFLS